MAVAPIVRYMILCDDWEADADHEQRFTIHGLMSGIRSVDDPPYPLLYEELRILLLLTEGYGAGDAQIICVHEETDIRMFGSPKHRVVFSADPVAIVSVAFRIKDCRFPQSGLYSVQFWYDGQMVAECPLRLR